MLTIQNGLKRTPLGVEELAYAFLATVRDVGQAVVDELAARVAVCHRVRRLEVGLLAQVDPEGRFALRSELVEDLGLDRRRPGALGGRCAGEYGRRAAEQRDCQSCNRNEKKAASPRCASGRQ